MLCRWFACSVGRRLERMRTQGELWHWRRTSDLDSIRDKAAIAAFRLANPPHSLDSGQRSQTCWPGWTDTATTTLTRPNTSLRLLGMTPQGVEPAPSTGDNRQLALVSRLDSEDQTLLSRPDPSQLIPIPDRFDEAWAAGLMPGIRDFPSHRTGVRRSTQCSPSSY